MRTARFGAVVGVLGLIAGATFAAGIADAAQHPERFGRTYDLLALSGPAASPPSATVPSAALAADPDVASAVELRTGTVAADGVDVRANSHTATGDPAPVVLTAGGLPTADGEAVLGSATARQLGAAVGSEVTLVGTAGSRTVRVTGVGLLPDDDYAFGAWLTPGGFDALTTAWAHAVVIDLRAGVEPGPAVARLQALVDSASGRGAGRVIVPAPPAQLTELLLTRSLFFVLSGVLLALLGGIVAYELVNATHRHRRELGVLRALGLTRRQARAVVATQASVLALVAVAAGVPLGLALGWLSWRIVAGLTPMQYVPPLPWPALVAAAPVALAAANLIAAFPGRRITRQPVTQALRAE